MSRTRVIHVDDMPTNPDAVYIGRAVPRRGLKKHRLANPYRIGPDGDRGEVVGLYRRRLQHWLRVSPITTTAMLREIAGKPLACWCRHDGEERTPDNACHGDVLVDLIRELRLAGEGDDGNV